MTGGRIKGPLYIDLEALFLCTSAMIRKIEAVLDEGVDIDQPMFARPLARMQQHVLDNRIGPPAVLYDFVEIIAQRIRQFCYFLARILVDLHSAQRFPQLIDQFGGDTGEVVDEIERVLDLVGDPGGQLAERSQLLRLDKAILRGAQVLQ